MLIIKNHVLSLGILILQVLSLPARMQDKGIIEGRVYSTRNNQPVELFTDLSTLTTALEIVEKITIRLK